MDQNDDKTLTLEEVYFALKNVPNLVIGRTKIPYDLVKKAFKDADADNSNEIDKDEFR